MSDSSQQCPLCDYRGMDPNITAVHLAFVHKTDRQMLSLTDDQLRAECERRGLKSKIEPVERVGEIIGQLAEALDAGNRALACDVLDAHFINPHVKCMSASRKLHADIRGLIVAAYEKGRDEWKARAEKAGAQLAKVPPFVQGMVGFMDIPRGAYSDVNLTPPSSLEARVRAENGGRIPTAEETMRKCMLGQESGPGIATIPEPRSEPLAFLDEDLLCADE